MTKPNPKKKPGYHKRIHSLVLHNTLILNIQRHMSWVNRCCHTIEPKDVCATQWHICFGSMFIFSFVCQRYQWFKTEQNKTNMIMRLNTFIICAFLAFCRTWNRLMNSMTLESSQIQHFIVVLFSILLLCCFLNDTMHVFSEWSVI